MITMHHARFATLTKAVVGALTATLLVASASAQQAYTTRQVNLRAGPDRGYP